MAISDIKKAVNYSLNLMIIIVVLTWINNSIDTFPYLASIHPLLDDTILPIVISILAAFVVIIIYYHNSHLIKRSRLFTYVAQSSPHTRKKIEYLLENFQESILVLYLDGEIIYSNEHARNIFSLSQNADDIFQEDGFPIKQYKIEAIKKGLLAGQIWEEKSLIRINGQERTFMHRIYPLSVQNDPAQVAIISTDITELAEARNNADLANLSKSQFLANMTHELRTPMIGILGSSDLLGHTSLSSEQHLHLDTIRECGEQLLNTINDILDLSKIDLGMDTLKPAAINLAKVVQKTVAMLDSNLKAKGLNMDLYIDPAFPPLILIDELKLRQLMTNILINAIKFTPSGHINVKAIMETDSQEDDFLLFSVEDTGIGIPADKLDTIFNCFTQADSSSCREFGGTGLGLYICKRLISLMSGDIWVNSEEGRGTTFAFRIPLNKASIEAEADTGNPIYPGNHDDGLNTCFLPIRILVVEDNELNQKLIIQMLISYGFEVEYVNNGLECLNILQQRSFDLILMDMQMPIMDGYEATRFIRANQNWQHIPIIAITANAMSGDRDKCLDCGCTSYLAKPFKSAELVQEIKSQLKTEFMQRSNHDLFSNQLIADLIPEFIELLAEMLNELQESINQHDLKNIQHISHSIKGTAGMYGFIQISEIAALIEQASRDEKYYKIPQLFTQMTTSYQQMNTRQCSDIVG